MGNLWLFGQVRGRPGQRAESALKIWREYNVRLVLSGLRDIADGETVIAGNSAIFISEMRMAASGWFLEEGIEGYQAELGDMSFSCLSL